MPTYALKVVCCSSALYLWVTYLFCGKHKCIDDMKYPRPTIKEKKCLFRLTRPTWHFSPHPRTCSLICYVHFDFAPLLLFKYCVFFKIEYLFLDLYILSKRMNRNGCKVWLLIPNLFQGVFVSL